MKTTPAIMCFAAGMLLVATAQARDTITMNSIEAALATADARQIGDDVQLFFGEQPHPSIAAKLGSYTSNKKTSGFGKSDEAACQRAFLSAMITFQQRARTEGGNAVVNLTSYYKGRHVSSMTEFECGSGAVISGVAFRGDVVRLD